MRSSRVTLVLGALCVLAGLGGGIALAQDATTVLENRQNVMKAQGKDMGAIKAYIDDKGDLPSAQTAGADLVQQIGKIPTLFPKDTGMAHLPGKSYAKPGVWTESEKFAAAHKTALSKAEALNASLKTGDKAAITAAHGEMGKSCGACHEPYREKKT
jgi:cytochrome c556